MQPEPEPIVNRWELVITAEAEVIKAPVLAAEPSTVEERSHGERAEL
jgi:hypothetical protein